MPLEKPGRMDGAGEASVEDKTDMMADYDA
jgi:hypothetical protein